MVARFLFVIPLLGCHLLLRVRLKRWNKLVTWAYHISSKVFLKPLFWTSGDVSSGFQNQKG